MQLTVCSRARNTFELQMETPYSVGFWRKTITFEKSDSRNLGATYHCVSRELT